MRTTSPVAQTAGELWDALASKYGLDSTGHDRDLVDDIRAALGLPPAGDVRTALQKHDVTVDALLHAVLASLGPFAGMLTDLLRLYESAASTRADHPNLMIEYDFGAGRPPLPFDLETFRAWAEVGANGARLARAQAWSIDRLWSLAGLIRDFASEDPGNSTRRRSEVDSWLRIYDAGEWPRSVPMLPLTGRDTLDRLLRRVRSVAVDVLRQCREVSSDRRALQQRRDREALDQGLEDVDLARAYVLADLDSDPWLRETVTTLDSVVIRLRTGNVSDIAAFEQKVSAALDSVSMTSASVERMAEALTEVLSLPAWERRHELYAAWVLTLIVDTAGLKRCELHPTADGKLSFSFQGSHVATIATPAHGPVLVWAELRSPATNPIGRGRTRAIQPDYTLLRAPVTSPSSALAVVECKQYRRASPGKFAEALQDYAAGRPAAQVMLVNYGPARSSILERVAEPERNRCGITGRLRPDEPALKARFAAWLRDAIGLKHPAAVVTRGNNQPSADRVWATIRLDWSHQPSDLDLHVVVGSDPAETIYHGNRGDLEKPPFARLDDDITNGYGPETVTVTRPTRLNIFVKRFSNDGTLATSDARVSVQAPKADVTLRIPPPRDVGETIWYVAEISPDGTLATGIGHHRGGERRQPPMPGQAPM
ncbi:hypothetical protein ACGGAQ_30230 [Micromonospora sp. NPDC047557]|uniref:hypothetical protein n=1 Tax=Micromonospora sp. NPDC047557 TaxID=3364250 RepID=UPI00370FFDFF